MKKTYHGSCHCTETIPYGREKALYLIHQVGETFPLWPDHLEEHNRHQPKESKVVECQLDPSTENQVIVIVTDPDDADPNDG